MTAIYHEKRAARLLGGEYKQIYLIIVPAEKETLYESSRNAASKYVRKNFSDKKNKELGSRYEPEYVGLELGFNAHVYELQTKYEPEPKNQYTVKFIEQTAVEVTVKARNVGEARAIAEAVQSGEGIDEELLIKEEREQDNADLFMGWEFEDAWIINAGDTGAPLENWKGDSRDLKHYRDAQ